MSLSSSSPCLRWLLLLGLCACPLPKDSEEPPSDTQDSDAAEDTDTGNQCLDDTDSGHTGGPDTSDTGETGETGDTGETAETGDTGEPGPCPSDMALVGAICIDRYEASRPDATSTWMGVDTSAPRSRAGVLPWMEASHDAASAACATVGKRLCAPDEWQAACQGPDGTVYPYGNTYEAATCNGIDTQCDCDPPYAGCYYACGGTYGPMATGSLAGCVNEYGLHDMSGNLWEHVEGSGSTALRGGAYNCGDSTSNHMCSFTPGWMPSALGFRCCLTPSA